MALISNFHRTNASTSQIDPTTVTCDWRWFDSKIGPVLELRTGGSATRKHPGKASQKLQVDRRAALNLVQVLEEAFPGLLDEYRRTQLAV